MGRPCSICTHPKRRLIEKARALGTSKRQIAVRYNVSSDAIQRHTAHSASVDENIAPLIAPLEGESHQHMTSRETGALNMPEPAPIQVNAVTYPPYAEPEFPQRQDDRDEGEATACPCDWCQLSPYRRLKRAWEETTEIDHGRLNVEIAPFDVPF